MLLFYPTIWSGVKMTKNIKLYHIFISILSCPKRLGLTMEAIIKTLKHESMKTIKQEKRKREELLDD